MTIHIIQTIEITRNCIIFIFEIFMGCLELETGRRFPFVSQYSFTSYVHLNVIWYLYLHMVLMLLLLSMKLPPIFVELGITVFVVLEDEQIFKRVSSYTFVRKMPHSEDWEIELSDAGFSPV